MKLLAIAAVFVATLAAVPATALFHSGSQAQAQTCNPSVQACN
jgi:hypothetical protein